MPDISVLMPVYGNKKYLQEAICSILNQTFKNFEFIIINDDCDKETIEILENFRKIDSRICIYQQDNRIGIIASLNLGCKVARGKYIARMDADDISMPNRLERQINYMELHPEVGVLGSWIEYIDKNGNSIGSYYSPSSPYLIKWMLLFGNYITHSAVMMRYELIQSLNFYNEEAENCEDYDLWARVCLISHISNVQENLLKYRLHEDNVSLAQTDKKNEAIFNIRQFLIKRVTRSDCSNQAILLLNKYVRNSESISSEEIEIIDKVIKFLVKSFIEKNKTDKNDTLLIARDASIRSILLVNRLRKLKRIYEGFILFIMDILFYFLMYIDVYLTTYR